VEEIGGRRLEREASQEDGEDENLMVDLGFGGYML